MEISDIIMDIVKAIADLFGTALDELKKRATSPLAGTFFISWAIINWRLLYYFVVSDDAVVDKIFFIDIFFMDYSRTLLWPIGITALYITFYPFLISISNTVWVLMDRFAKYLSTFVLEKQTRITKEEQRRLYELMRQKENEYKRQLETKQETIDTLYTSLNSLNTEKSQEPSKEIYFKQAEDWEDEQKRLLEQQAPRLDIKMSEYLNSKDGSYYVEDLIANQMHLDKDDEHHQTEIIIVLEIIKAIAKIYPEPWGLREISAQKNGRNISVGYDNVHSKVKKMKRMSWVEEMSDGEDKMLFMLSPKLIMELNAIINKPGQQ